MYKIVNHLYFSNEKTIYNYHLMKRHNIKYAINTTHNNINLDKMFNYYKDSKLDSKNNYNYTIIKYPSFDPHTDEDIKFIKKTIKKMLSRIDYHIKKKQNILIYCHYGKHRSVTLCMLYLMYKYNFSYEICYSIMKRINNDIFDNVGLNTIELLLYYSNNRELLRK